MGDGERLAAVHVDLDGVVDIYRSHGWHWKGGEDSIFASGMRAFLDFFDRNDVRATLFCIAESLDDPAKLEWVREAVRRGHEIASHSLTHAHLRKIDRDAKHREIAESREKLERLLGVTVHGFRAAGYQIDRESIELLEQSGYVWDSSAFPTRGFARWLEVPVERLTGPDRPFGALGLMELPLPDHRPFPFPFNPSYSLLLGRTYYRMGLRRNRGKRTPLFLLFHLIDLAEPLGATQLGPRFSRLFTLSSLSAERKRDACQWMLDRLRREYVVTPTEELVRGIGGES